MALDVLLVGGQPRIRVEGGYWFFEEHRFRWLQAFCNGSVAQWRQFLRKLVFALERARFRLTSGLLVCYHQMSG